MWHIVNSFSCSDGCSEHCQNSIKGKTVIGGHIKLKKLFGDIVNILTVQNVYLYNFALKDSEV